MPVTSEIFGVLVVIPGHFYSCQFKMKGAVSLYRETAFLLT